MVEAHDGEAALAKVAAERFDLILLDIQLPGIDGYEVARRIRADSANKDIPIIAVTSYALMGDEGKARAAGCNDYVSKPYRPRELLAKIRDYLPV
jgi:two-component system, cell cycle response regulator DivK